MKRRTSIGVGAVCLALCVAGAVAARSSVKPPAGPDAGTASLDAKLRAAPAFRPPAPFAGVPTAYASDALVPMPTGWWVPPADLWKEPRVLPTDGLKAFRPRPTADVPPLAREAEPAVPAPVRMAAAPPVSVSSPDPERLPSLPTSHAPHPDQVGATTDPAAEAVREASLAALPEFRKVAPGFLRLAIPDPYESVRDLRLRRQLPDDCPEVPDDLPPKPPLPVRP